MFLRILRRTLHNWCNQHPSTWSQLHNWKIHWEEKSKNKNTDSTYLYILLNDISKNWNIFTIFILNYRWKIVMWSIKESFHILKYVVQSFYTWAIITLFNCQMLHTLDNIKSMFVTWAQNPVYYSKMWEKCMQWIVDLYLIGQFIRLSVNGGIWNRNIS